jgi:hypothetical protein
MSAAVGLPPAAVAPARRTSAPADRAGSGAAFASTFEQLSRRETRDARPAGEPTSVGPSRDAAATATSRNESRADAAGESAGTAAAATEADGDDAATGESITDGPTGAGRPNLTLALDAQPPSSGIPVSVPDASGALASAASGSGLPMTSPLGVTGSVDQPSALITNAGIQGATEAADAPGNGASGARLDGLESAGAAGAGVGIAAGRDGDHAVPGEGAVAGTPVTVDAAQVDIQDGRGTRSGTANASGSGGGAVARPGDASAATTESTTDEGSVRAGGAAPAGATVSAGTFGGLRSDAERSAAALTDGSGTSSGVEQPANGSMPVAARPGNERPSGTATSEAVVSGGAATTVASVRDTSGQTAAGAPFAPAPATLAGASASTAATPAPAPAAAPLHGTAAAAFAAQLTQPVLRLASTASGERSITVRIAPEELGPVTVRAVVGADGVRIELTAAGDAGREALRQVVGDLRRDLAATGSGATLDLGAGSGRDADAGTGSDASSAGREASASPTTDAEARRAEASALPTRSATAHAWHPTSTTLDTLA